MCDHSEYVWLVFRTIVVGDDNLPGLKIALKVKLKNGMFIHLIAEQNV